MKKPSLLCLVLALAACGGGAPLSPPIDHRTLASACAPTALGGIACQTTPADPSQECGTSADCTAGTNGRCLVGRGPCYCAYDTCSTDADCGAGAVCECSGGTGHSASSNRCVAADCRTDSDCGASQFCAPALDESCGSYVGVTAYRCTTPKDRCRLDADCRGASGTAYGYCNFSSELGYWACSNTVCAG